jgi:hypothetical protein
MVSVTVVSADGVSVDEVVDSVQSDESGNDQVDGNDVIQQARQNQDQDACDKRNDRRKMFGGEGHERSPGWLNDWDSSAALRSVTSGLPFGSGIGSEKDSRTRGGATPTLSEKIRTIGPGQIWI